MAGLLSRLCFISFLILFLFPDLNTDSTASAAPAQGPKILSPREPPSKAPAGAAPTPGLNVLPHQAPPPNRVPAGAPPPANQATAGLRRHANRNVLLED
ncbi:hypothetical protein SLA2020_402630 [Shorea laevis]